MLLGLANVFTIVIFIYKFIAGIYLVHYFYIAVCNLINMDVIMRLLLALSFTGVSQGKQYNNVSEFEPFGYLGIGYQYADADINLGSLGSYSLNNSPSARCLAIGFIKTLVLKSEVMEVCLMMSYTAFHQK